MLRIFVVALAVLAAVPAAASAQASLTGLIIDVTTGLPVSGVQLSLADSAGRLVGATLSNDDGLFQLEAPAPGFYALEVRRVGYAPLDVDSLELRADGATEVEIRLGVDAVPLDPVIVVARTPAQPQWITRFRERAEQNRRTGMGRIYTRDDLDRIGPITAQDLLGTMIMRGRCQPVVLLDGLPAEGMLGSVRTEDLEGVEMYRGITQIPPEFYRTGMCALVMFWQRHDIEGPPLTWRRVGVASVILLLLGAMSWIF